MIAAACEGGHRGSVCHDRTEMEFDHARQILGCTACGFTATPERASREVPAAYRPSRDPIGAALQAMADYRLLVIFGRNGATVEYPRPSLDGRP